MGPDHEPMSSESGSHTFKFPKLNSQNYSLWAEHMQATLQSHYLWLIVNGIETCPQAPSLKTRTADAKAEKREYLDWLLHDQAAQGLMKGAMESSQWPHISPSPDHPRSNLILVGLS